MFLSYNFINILYYILENNFLNAKQRLKERKIEVIYTLFAPDKYKPTH